MSEEKSNSKQILILIALVVVLIAVAVIVFINRMGDTETNTNETTTNKVEVTEMKLKSSTSGSFAMPISYVGKTNKGITISGTIERGSIKVNDEIQIVGMGKEVINTKVIAISKGSMANTSSNTTANTSANETQTNTVQDTAESVKQASRGDEIVLTIEESEDYAKEDISRGQVACEPYTYNQYNTFTASVKLNENNALKITDISKLNGETLQIYIRIVDINGEVTVKQADSVDSGTISVKLESYVALEQGTEISIRKDSKTIASGTITGVSNT